MPRPLLLTDEMHQRMVAGVCDAMAEQLSLVVERQQMVECSRDECEQCGALTGGILFPELSPFDPATLADAMEEHDPHWRTVYTPVMPRVAAHIEKIDAGVLVVPDVDEGWAADVQGFYRITVYSGDNWIAWVEMPPMTAGAVIDTLTVGMG